MVHLCLHFRDIIVHWDWCGFVISIKSVHCSRKGILEVVQELKSENTWHVDRVGRAERAPPEYLFS